jgi:hypothetical protein
VWSGANLKRLDKRPEQRSYALSSTQQLNQSHDAEEAEKVYTDDGGTLRLLQYTCVR